MTSSCRNAFWCVWFIIAQSRVYKSHNVIRVCFLLIKQKKYNEIVIVNTVSLTCIVIQIKVTYFHWICTEEIIAIFSQSQSVCKTADKFTAESQSCCHGCSDVAHLELHWFMIGHWLVTSSTVELISDTNIGFASIDSSDVTDFIRHAHRRVATIRCIVLYKDLNEPVIITLFVIGIVESLVHC